MGSPDRKGTTVELVLTPSRTLAVMALLATDSRTSTGHASDPPSCGTPRHTPNWPLPEKFASISSCLPSDGQPSPPQLALASGVVPLTFTSCRVRSELSSGAGENTSLASSGSCVTTRGSVMHANDRSQPKKRRLPVRVSLNVFDAYLLRQICLWIGKVRGQEKCLTE